MCGKQSMEKCDQVWKRMNKYENVRNMLEQGETTTRSQGSTTCRQVEEYLRIPLEGPYPEAQNPQKCTLLMST